MEKELMIRCAQEISNCIYDLLHSKEAAIYPPDEYDREASELLDRLENGSTRQSSIDNDLRSIFLESLEHEYPRGSFDLIASRVSAIYQKYQNIHMNLR